MRRLHGLAVRRAASLCAAPLFAVLLAPLPAAAQGLAPPPPLAPAPGTPLGSPEPQHAATMRRLDEAERQDSGRNFELFWLDGQVGGSYIDMAGLSSSGLQLDRTGAGGPAFSVGAGARFVVFVLGARVRYHPLSSFDMWQVNGEAGLKIPVRSFDVLFGVHAGYSFVGRLDAANLASGPGAPASADAVSVRGLNAGLDVAVDYYLSPLFSVGVGVLGDALFLSRPRLDLPAGFADLPPEQQRAVESDPLYQRSGSSVGLGLSGGLRLGLHLGL